jgi:voltage-gated potassium channel
VTHVFQEYPRKYRSQHSPNTCQAIRSAKHLVSFFYRKKADGVLVSVSLIAFVVIIFSSISILNVESVPNSNIKNAPDAIWWAITTLTTVGYGDKYPVTYEGKIIAVILMAAGIALVGTFTAYVASLFFETNEARDFSADSDLWKEIREIKDALKRMEDRY